MPRGRLAVVHTEAVIGRIPMACRPVLILMSFLWASLVCSVASVIYLLLGSFVTALRRRMLRRGTGLARETYSLQRDRCDHHQQEEAHRIHFDSSGFARWMVS